MFQLTEEEFSNRNVHRKPRLVGGVKGHNMKRNYLTGKPRPVGGELHLKSQIVISSCGDLRRARPYAFTEQGVAMLSSVLRSKRAIQVNIEIMRAFVRLRRLLSSHADLARKLDALEKKYDAQFEVVFDAIRELMKPPEPKKRPIGFLVEEAKVPYAARNRLRGQACNVAIWEKKPRS